MNVYEYKGYLGSAEVDTSAGLLVGKLLFLRDSIAYSASNPVELEAAFHEAVDEYLATCNEFGDTPDLPCKGSFNVRIDPYLHRCVALEAMACNVTMNRFVEQALQIACSKKVEHHSHTHNMIVQAEKAPTTGIASAGVSTSAAWAVNAAGSEREGGQRGRARH